MAKFVSSIKIFVVLLFIMLSTSCLVTPSMITNVNEQDGDDILYKHISSLTTYDGAYSSLRYPQGVRQYKQALIRDMSFDGTDFLLVRRGDRAEFWVEHGMFSTKDKNFIKKLMKQMDSEGVK